jgi:plasmid stabilization system protein ParE
MKIRYTCEALSEIADILSYIARDNPIAANEVSLTIEDTIAMIRGQPRLARVVYHGQVRAFPVGEYPYRIFYQAEPAEIVVRNVRHTRRQRPWEGE